MVEAARYVIAAPALPTPDRPCGRDSRTAATSSIGSIAALDWARLQVPRPLTP